jgi:hypothetical protein
MNPEGPQERENLDASGLEADRYTQAGVHPPAADIDAYELEPVALRDARMRRFVGSYHFVDGSGEPTDLANVELSEETDDPNHRDDEEGR